MAIKQLKLGTTRITTIAKMKTRSVPRQLQEVPGGLYPLRMAYWETDPYRVVSGWPIPIPECDIRANTLISAEGEVLADREQPRSLITGALMRWLADEDTYDLTSLSWYPYQNLLDMRFDTAPDYAPTLITNYEYQIGEEIFFTNALNFDSDSGEHLWGDLNSLLGGASGYTVIMCASVNSVYGNNEAIPYSGLWCPGQPTPLADTFTETPDGGWFSLTLQGSWLYLETDQTPRTRVLAISDLMSSAAPFMLALVMSRPYATIYAARGPSSINRAKVETGDAVVPLDGRVVVGRSNGDIRHTADMALLDLGIYGELLTPAMVKSEFALLSGAYGGDK